MGNAPVFLRGPDLLRVKGKAAHSPGLPDVRAVVIRRGNVAPVVFLPVCVHEVRPVPLHGAFRRLLLRPVQQGEIVSIPADRLFGSLKSVSVPLLDAPVSLPVGPFTVAIMRGLPVLAVNVMKQSSTQYVIYVKPLDYDKQAPRKTQIEQLARGYTTELERMLGSRVDLVRVRDGMNSLLRERIQKECVYV